MKLKLFSALALLLTFFLAAAPALAEPVDFSLPSLDGKLSKLSDYRGKWVVVNYWATWCPPCVAEMPELDAFHNSYKDKNAVVIGVNMESIDREILKDFVEAQMVSYPILQGKPAVKTELGKVPGMPTTYLVSPEGEVVARQVGMVNKEMLESFIQKNGE